MLPITPEQLAALPPAIRDIVQAIIDHYEARIAQLETELAAARTTPQNSSKPPSTEHPHAKPRKPQKPKSQKKRGGQPGHKKHHRELIPTTHCDDVVVLLPTACRGCQRPLAGADDSPLRHQVWELPEIKPHVTEYQRHRLSCGCGVTTCAPLPVGVPDSQAGPNLVAFTATLMGCFRQSKRRVALFLEMVLQQPCSPGWVVKLQNQATAALQPAYQELVDKLPQQKVLGGDETPTKQGSVKAWLWAFVASSFTLFAIRPTRKADVLTELIGQTFDGVMVCDRAKMYWQCGHLQWCWAHLQRDFQKWVESPDGVVKRLGQDLRRATRTLFELWRQVREGTLSRVKFRQAMTAVQRTVEGLLLRGRLSGKAGVAGSCEELYTHRSWLWTFVTTAGVEPTNNASERALRPAVIWRKLSFGTQSESGSRFVETLLSVVETCRQQNRNVLAFVRASVQAHFAQQPTPSLLTGV